MGKKKVNRNNIKTTRFYSELRSFLNKKCVFIYLTDIRLIVVQSWRAKKKEQKWRNVFRQYNLDVHVESMKWGSA